MTTNNTALHYCGHSQGGTVVMAMLSTFPRYNKKLKTVHLLAPAVYMSDAVSFYKIPAMFSEALEVTNRDY